MTRLHWSRAHLLPYFNSHPHEEDDTSLYAFICSSVISTHILTKRMTIFFKILTNSYKNFNSHPHEEDDLPASWILRSSYRHFNSHPHEEDDWIDHKAQNPAQIFQLTSSRRGWRTGGTWMQVKSYFNSHPHEEDDLVVSYTASSRYHFNSHPHEEDDNSLMVVNRA